MGVTGGLMAESYDRAYDDQTLIRRIGHYFRPHLGKVGLVAFMVVLNSLSATILPMVIAQSIDSMGTSPSFQLAMGAAALVTVLGVLGWVFSFIRQWFASSAVGNVVLALRQDAFQAVLKRDMSFFDEQSSGRIVSRVTSDTQDFATTVTLTVDLISQLVLVIVIAAVLLFVNWQLALITIACGPLVISVALVFRRIARRVMQRSQRATANVNAVVQETLSGMAVAKNFRREATIYADFQVANAQAYQVALQRVAVFGSIYPVLNTLSGMGVAIIVYFGGRLVIENTVSIGEWYLFVQALSIFFRPLTGIASFWSQFQQGLAAAERVFALLDANPRVTQYGDRPVARLRGEISFEQVDFSYTPDQPAQEQKTNARQAGPTGSDTNDPEVQPESAPPRPGEPSATTEGHLLVLNNFNLHIPAGEALAIVGHTGAGKSSIVKLLLRFYEFQGGQLLIDGQDIRTLNLAEYRHQIGLVPQVPLLFSGTVADNIRYGRPDASDAEVATAAHQLGDGSWIDDLPNGLATDVGERGARLSLGQRQLVALARVLFHNPAILLLDEATASVDPFTEAQIQRGLASVLKDRTSIVIAHRLATVRHADRIIVMQHGQIVEQGHHEALLEAGGHYAELYTTYFRHQEAGYQAP